MLSAVLTVPVASREDANTLGEAMGWGPDNYSVPLGPVGGEDVTHYGLHAWAEQSFVDTLGAAAGGHLPVVPGMTPQQVGGVLSALVFSVRTSSEGHWASVLADRGLEMRA